MVIGNVTTNNNVFLAPMAGVTDCVFRQICQKYGAGLTYSEMVSAKGIHYKDKKTRDLLKRGSSNPYAVQIFGSDPNIMGEITPEVSQYGDIIDINMGCPTPKIINNGDGSALLKDISLLKKVARAVCDNTDKPVTVKIRLGWDSNNSCEVAKALEQSGVSAIAVHGRTREQFYSGNADITAIKNVVESVKIPIIANGDITTPTKALDVLNYTGAAAIMIGRGAEGNPFIFKQITEYLRTGESHSLPTPQEVLNQAIEHIKLLVVEKGEIRGIKEARKHMAWYIKGMRNNTSIKNDIFKSENLEEIIEILTDFSQKLQ